jgi:2-polyprenyl-6-methoxyphenol hydroxylase-like FAD-dependent oxidoreductase
VDILISGAGIAGPTLAYWLLRHGHKPTLIEEAPALRKSGYVVDFWGAGFDVAERMGLRPQIMNQGYLVKEIRLIGDKGERLAGFPINALDRLTRGRYVSIARSDLAATIYGAIKDKAETIFGEQITALNDCGDHVQASFLKMKPRRFDIVIGADGLHSAVRDLAFGRQSQFEKYLGYKVAAFETDGYRPRDELTYVSYSAPGVQIARFALHDDHTLFLLIYVDPNPEMPSGRDVAAQKRELRNRYEALPWESAKILQAMDRTDSLYFDRVSQIRMPHWSKGRVALIGDAAAAPSLVAGEGAALAMAAAYVLAGEIALTPQDPQAAFARYQDRLHRIVLDKQNAAERFAGALVPRTRFGILVRNLITNFMHIPFVAERALSAQLRDRISLPAYA